MSAIGTDKSGGVLTNGGLDQAKFGESITENAAWVARRALGLMCAGAVCWTNAFEVAAVSPVIDGARSFGAGELARLEDNLNRFEAETSYRVRVLTRDARRPDRAASGEEIKQEWKLPDERAIIVLIDSDKGNVLRFNVGKDVAKLLPDQFFGELQGRFGNTYTVQKEGEDGVVQDAVAVIEKCLKQGGCRVVPGIGEDQYSATMACSAVGGFVFGFTILTSMTELQSAASKRDSVWAASPLLFAPLWGSFLGLGLNPLIARQADSQLVLQNVGTFLGMAAAVAVAGPLISSLKEPPSDDDDGGGGGGGGKRELAYQTITLDRD